MGASYRGPLRAPHKTNRRSEGRPEISEEVKVTMKTIVQISLDITNIPEALETAALALRAGVDWLEAGTPLIIPGGMNGVRALRAAFPDVPLVAGLTTRDGGWLEARLIAEARRTH